MDARGRELAMGSAGRRVLTTRWAELDLAVASGCSVRHAVNEDSYSALDRTSPVYVVADGVGGGAMASWASRELVSRLHAALDRRRVDADSMRDALLDADREVGRSDREAYRRFRRGDRGAVCRDRSIVVAMADRVGGRLPDLSRAARGRSKPVELLTQDDTYGHLGENPPPGGSPDDPARMVGNGAVATPNVGRVHLRQDEMLVLCSDGLHKHVKPQEIDSELRAERSLAGRCVRLLELARTRSSSDDATLLVVHRKAPRGAGRMWAASLGGLTALLLVALALSHYAG